MGLEPEERNRVMDTFFDTLKLTGQWHFYGDMPTDQAIRECDRRARVLDAILDQLVNFKPGTEATIHNIAGYFVQQIHDLLLPAPKDPLEEELVDLDQLCANERLSEYGPIRQKIAEIRRLRKEGKKNA